MKALIQRVMNAKVCDQIKNIDGALRQRRFRVRIHITHRHLLENYVFATGKTVNEETISNIGQGLCIFIGLNTEDTIKDIEYMAKKILNVRLFDDDDKRWKKSVVDKQFEVLCVSQFTLYATWKGLKPDFHNAMPGEKSKELYDKLIEMLKNQYNADKIKDGMFGAYMQVSIQNDGPVTLEIESPVQDKIKSKKSQPPIVSKADGEFEDKSDR